jgi:hypothetical protein
MGIQKFEGRNSMIWDCIEWNKVEILSEVEGRMNAEQYIPILGECLLRSMQKSKVNKEDIIFS